MTRRALLCRAHCLCNGDQRAINSGEYAAPVDIRRRITGRWAHFRHSHIDDITIAQIDFRRASGAFQHNNVIFLRPAVIDRRICSTQKRGL